MKNKKRAYIAGKITGDPDYKDKFQVVENTLTKMGLLVMNPAILPEGFEYESYMPICFAMIDACEIIYFLPDWAESSGARREHEYVRNKCKEIVYI